MSNKHLLLIMSTLVVSVVLLFTTGLLFYQPSPQPLYAFASDRNGNGDIFVVDRNQQIHQLTTHDSSDWDPVWCPIGLKLAYTSHRTGDSDIWVLPVHSLHADQLSPVNLTQHPSWDYSPTWSPSGQSIAFVSERDGEAEIFVQHLEEETALQLTFNTEQDHRPAWSPDGRYIAFASVREGVEGIYRLRPDGTDEQRITDRAGTSPVWSPDSQRIAFISWDDEGRPGIYLTTMGEADSTALVYEGQSWLGSLDWSADGRWLTFTVWTGSNHEVMALSLADGTVQQVTHHAAWDDFLVVNPHEALRLPTTTAQAQQTSPPIADDFAVGMNLADLSKAYLLNDVGVSWAKSYVNWATVEPQPDAYQWADPDNIVRAFGDQRLNILMRIHGTPTWNRPPDTHLTHPPTDLAPFAKFLTELATRYRGQVQAYEIWNEPNLDYEWGYQLPDPTGYTKVLQTAYTAIKQADPNALVISGGLSTTGEGSARAYGDLAFLQGMYDAGAKGYFDAFGSHPYSFGQPPDAVDPYGLSLARVIEQHAVMQANGDGATPIWITETGWVLETEWDLGEHERIGVTEAQQAEYVAHTYRKVQREWPFVEGLFLFNLDFSTVSWYPAAEPMRWYAILNPDRTPRPAYTQLRETLR